LSHLEKEKMPAYEKVLGICIRAARRQPLVIVVLMIMVLLGIAGIIYLQMSRGVDVSSVVIVVDGEEDAGDTLNRLQSEDIIANQVNSGHDGDLSLLSVGEIALLSRRAKLFNKALETYRHDPTLRGLFQSLEQMMLNGPQDFSPEYMLRNIRHAVEGNSAPLTWVDLLGGGKGERFYIFVEPYQGSMNLLHTLQGKVYRKVEVIEQKDDQSSKVEKLLAMIAPVNVTERQVQKPSHDENRVAFGVFFQSLERLAFAAKESPAKTEARLLLNAFASLPDPSSQETLDNLTIRLIKPVFDGGYRILYNRLK